MQKSPGIALLALVWAATAGFATGSSAAGPPVGGMPLNSMVDANSVKAWEEGCAHRRWFCRLDLVAHATSWEFVNVTADSKPAAAYFLTEHDMRREGYIVSMWERIEYNGRPHGYPYRSVLAHARFDCLNDAVSLDFAIVYSRNNLIGQLASHEYAPPVVQPITPGSVGEEEWNSACGRASGGYQ